MPDALPAPASPEPLTDVPSAAGVLTTGRVTSVAIESPRQLLVSSVMRLRLERECVRRYHAGLTTAGIGGYDFDALWRDYRLSVLWQITTPVWQAANGIGPWIWWYNYERVMAAVENLDCLEFLG